MQDDTFFPNKDGLLVDGNGNALATFVDRFILQEQVFPEMSVILLRLYEDGTLIPGKPVSARRANQVRMSPRNARAHAALLNQAADRAEGLDLPTNRPN